MASLFFSYSHADEALRDQLETQLAMLKRQGIIETWHDRRIAAGEDLDHAIGSHVENDEVILLLISPDFLASNYCYDIEMTRAMERHAVGEAVVIPVILRACDWHGAPFGKLMATPVDGRPITQWPDRDQAFLEVAKSVRTAVQEVEGKRVLPVPSKALPPAPGKSGSSPAASAPRSSNLGLAKRFSDRDKDAFLHEAFDYMASFFENSLAELERRNEGIEGTFRRVDANRFFATAYRDGTAATRCTIFLGGMMGPAINFLHGETTESNSFNESLRVEADDLACYLRSMGMSYGRADDSKLTFEGAAELCWQEFIRPLQYR